jgi:putative ABC transport system substrate-binding protein
MQRREFIAGIGGAAATWPLGARAQQPAGRVYRIGFLSTGSREQTLHLIRVFEAGLRSLGYRIGENVVIEYRFADGETERVPACCRTGPARCGRHLCRKHCEYGCGHEGDHDDPIVMANSIDPVGAGLVATLARPGGNVTGFTQDTGDELNGKRLELLNEILPNISRLGILWNPDFAANRNRLASMREVARPLGLTLVSAEARRLDALEQAFATMVAERAQAFVMFADPMLFNYRSQVGVMALKDRLPAITGPREFAEAGLLLTYGANLQDLFRRLAVFIDKIFKGAKPADLPVEQPTKFELVINLKTAKALGIIVPPTLLTRADEVIE